MYIFKPNRKIAINDIYIKHFLKMLNHMGTIILIYIHAKQNDIYVISIMLYHPLQL